MLDKPLLVLSPPDVSVRMSRTVLRLTHLRRLITKSDSIRASYSTGPRTDLVHEAIF